MEEIFFYIKNSIIFKDLSKEDYQQISPNLDLLSFKKGDVIFYEGDQACDMFVLLRGEVAVHKKMGSDNRELNRLQAGDCFGEMALISDDNRSATVVAVEDTECLCLSKASFSSILEKSTKLYHRLLQVITKMLRDSEVIAEKQILKAYEVLIFSLADLAESRDPETGAHIYRVQHYCSLLAELMISHPLFGNQIDGYFIKNIHTTSPLHDIGKVGIADTILLKPGKLTDEEYKIMESHTVIGASTLEKVLEHCSFTVFQMAYNIIYYHHERYDGTGYPAKLSGNNIPIEARIMALADVYDALLSKRVYKAAFTYGKTREIIREGQGSHFDPAMVDMMLDNIEKFEAIHRQFAD